MKKTAIALAIAAIAITANAQDQTLEREAASPTIGIKAEWNLNSPSTSYNDMLSVYSNGSGFSVGSFVTVPIYRGLYVEPQVDLYYNTMIIDPDIIQAVVAGQEVPAQGSLRNFGFRIPLTVGYRFDFTDDMAVSVFTGPQLNVGLTFDRYDNGTKRHYSLYDEGWRRLDAQWTFGARYYYADNWMAEISGGVGMTNLLGKSLHGHFRRNTFSIGVGYIF